MNKKTIAGLMAFVLLIGAGVGVTLAYLNDKTSDVVNTFTVGKVDIDLWENNVVTNAQTGAKELGNEKVYSNNTDYKIIPGGTDPKNPTVEVIKGSETCYVFIKVVEANNAVTGNANATQYVSWTPATGWTELPNAGVTNGRVFWREVSASEVEGQNKTYPVLETNKVMYDQDLTSTDLKKITDTTKPTLTFTAFAVQKTNGTSDFTPAQAWEQAQTASIENINQGTQVNN